MFSENKDDSNLIAAILISLVIIIVWRIFYAPVYAPISAYDNKQIEKDFEPIEQGEKSEIGYSEEEDAIINKSGKVSFSCDFENDFTIGSFTDSGNVGRLSLKKYLDDNDSPVELLTSNSEDVSVISEFGWLTSDLSSTDLPSASSRWKLDKSSIVENEKVSFSFYGKKVKITVSYLLDDQYMMRVEQKIENTTDSLIEVRPYAKIIKSGLFNTTSDTENISLSDTYTVKRYSYGKLFKRGEISQDISGKEIVRPWVGINDKYWLVSLSPESRGSNVSIFTKAHKRDKNRFYVETGFTGDKIAVEARGSSIYVSSFFAGPKEMNILDYYSKSEKIFSLDKAVDFGRLHFISKSLLVLLNKINNFCGNFGISILFLTLLVKAIMLPLSMKSHVSMAKLRDIQPSIKDIKEKYNDNRASMNSELATLFSRNKVNPMSGCLPILLQIPVFFALYKVLYLSIELRDAPFFGWVHDLSGPDPINVLAVFRYLGLRLDSIVKLGIWPIILAITMIVQNSLNKGMQDVSQESAMKIMPYVFMFLFSSMPVGLVIYWSWSNIISSLQQVFFVKLLSSNKRLT